MEIRPYLILDNLRERYPVLCFGKCGDVPLLRPTFYGRSGEVEKNRIYVARPNSLPPQQLLDSSMLLICVEGMPSLAYQHCGTPLFVIRNAGIMEVFNDILSIFEKYEAWEKSLDNILITTAAISDLIQITAPLLMNDITVIDKDLRVIAAASYHRDPEGKPEEICHAAPMETMPLEFARKYCSGHNELKTKRGSFFADEGCYCCNLFLEEQYWGNVSLYPQLMSLRQSDPYVFDILAAAILKALRINNVSVDRKTSILEQLAWNLLERGNVDYEKVAEYESGHADLPLGRFLCLCIHISHDPQQMSEDYLSQMIRKQIPSLVVFQFDGYLAGITDLADSSLDYEQFMKELLCHLEQLDLRAGISNRFHHLRNISSYYQQARCTLDWGLTANTSRHTYLFQDYALRYLLINSSGSFPAKYLCPAGLRALQRYDETSEVDYWGTLRCYLDTERNIAHAAKILRIHRNTMIQRIERIQAMLEMDLEDAMTRLWLRIAIWLIDEEAAVEANG